ncbi:unnamed protein product [Rotaria sp. Silwood2]|nr:unnamed protein product [Rotaria sp. Silwood2]
MNFNYVFVAFGKSTVHTLLKSAVMNEYSVLTTGDMYDHRKSTILEGFDTFFDETSAAGLQAGLVNGDKMIFSDEGENILKNNGLLVDENMATSSAYDLHNFVLLYYVSILVYAHNDV